MSNDTAILSLKEKIDDLNQQAWEVRVTDLPKAFELSEESVKLARSISYPKGLAEGLRSLGFSYVRFFKNDEAAPLLKESLSLFQSLNDLKGQAIVYEYLGIIERNWGNLGTSLELLLKGNDLIRQTDPPEVEITSCYQIGVTYKHLGNHENALDYLYRTLSLSKKINFTLMEAYATHIIGSIYFDNGNYNQALDCYQQGLVIRRQSHDKWGEAGSLDNIGFTYLKLNDLDKAIEYCKQSLAICQASGDKKGEANALLHLGEIYEQAGDIKQAAGFSNESLEIRKARGDKRGETEVLLFLADLYKNRSDVEDHQIFEWLSGALKIADEIKAQDLLSKACYNLHEYYQQKGNFKESLIQLEAHFQIEKELHKNSINQKIANLEISHKAEIVSQRNKELTELNEKIEKANEELKIEASLERVRTVAMSIMKPADLLEICKALYKELLHLGFTDLRNVIIHIFDDDNKYLLDYDYSEENGGYITKILYGTNPVLDRFLKQIKVSEDAFAEVIVDGSELNEWRNYRLKTGQPSELRLEEANALYYYFHSIGLGDIGLSTFKPVIAQQTDILKRFRNVFELAYRRYTDVTNAEAQAKEAQIQLALERVRARTMAMQRSDELREAVLVIYEQLQQLNFESRACNIIIIDKESGSAQYWVSGFSQEIFPESYNVPYLDHPYQDALLNPWKQGDKYVVYEYTGQMKQSFDEIFFTQTEFRNVPEDAKKVMIGLKSVILSTAFISYGALQALGAEPLSEEKANILKRFAKVFEQTYTRFLDLQKAEAQARESQIEAALERVRSRTMAMQRSAELAEAATVLFQQVKALGVPQWTCGFGIFEIDDKEFTWYPGSADGDILPPVKIPLTEHPVFISFNDSRKRGDELFVYEKEGEYQAGHYRYMQSLPGVGEMLQKMLDAGLTFPTFQIDHVANFSHGNLVFITYEHFPEMHDIFKRFAKVFEQTYTRFLDLQKAEAQAREAKIEVALEKVRSRTMGMQRSEELGDVATVLFKEMNQLVENLWTCGFVLCERDRAEDEWWLSTETGFIPAFYLPNTGDATHENIYNGWKNGETYHTEQLEGDALKEHYEWLYNIPVAKRIFDEMIAGGFSLPTWQKLHCAYFSKGYLCIITQVPCQEVQVFKRFAQVFDLTYTRFLDLQKAEAQARESQIEAALEKVRSRSLAMHTANELGEVVTVIVEKLKDLGVVLDANGVVLCTYFQNSKNVLHWIVSPDYSMAGSYLLPYFDHPIFNAAWQSKENGDEYFSRAFSVAEKNSFFEHAFEHSDYRHFPDEFKQWIFQNDQHILSFAWQKNSAILIPSHTGVLPSEEDVAILKRFSKVFEQSYVRFLDLQKAEAQAREAQIEAALEKVRGRAMAIRKSDELSEVIQIIFQEMNKLGIDLMECSIATYDDTTPNDLIFWSAGPFGSAQSSSTKLQYIDHPLLIELLNDFKNGTLYRSGEYSGELLNTWWERIFVETDFKYAPKEFIESWKNIKQVFYSQAAMNHGFLEFLGKAPMPEDKVQILKRFTNVVDLTYTRYDDVIKAEAQAREAQIEAALERVRSRTMGMQKSEELKDVIQVVYEQFVHLNIHIEHTGFIMDYKTRDDMHIWLADQNEVPSEVTIPYFDCAHWNSFNESKKKGKSFFANHLSFEEKNKFYQDLFKLIPGMPEETKEYYFSCPGLAISTVLLDNVGLYIENFSGTPYTDEENATLMRFGKVFQQTYTRFNDLKLAEAHAVQAEEDLVKLQTEKKRAEDALSELQVTQKQLIQSEKMASLGELTAGIAHEIQNPLNFVNNFSDVNKELLGEMKEEIEKGNTEEVIAIANDIISNEEKINHHGKRADAIVKGMLQHSRSSSGVKEPTDINELADEYLRLAYHGLRAKDKSFNATMKTDFDETVGKVNVIPQDIGRVFLNLITNAFYVVNEKKNQMPPSPKGEQGNTPFDYEPIVTVTTKRLGPPLGDGGKIEIRVADNGNGIPQKVLDKIFQPFFTTKPTGQGTGLGLSLSYDIVKAHSGEIKVKTKDGEGSEFIISLPV